MLHRIEQPPEAAHLRWVAGLQERLLRGLCDPATTGRTVTVAWVQGLWNDAPKAWVRKFCGRKALGLMRKLASATAPERAALVTGYLNDRQADHTFRDGTGGFRFLGLGCCGGIAALAQTAKALFGWFYEPHFAAGAGYSAPGVTLAKGQLDRPAFVEAFARHNNLGVCPYCDGTLAPKRAKVDHFYPKSEYPFLAVAPENLVPACTDCNSVQVKGAQVPLAVGAANEAAEWFHPYHRTADGQFRVEFLPPRANDQPRQLRLVGNDATTQRRLYNLDELLGVTAFWADRLKHRMTSRINALRTKRRKKRTALTDAELRDECAEWADEALAGKRHSEFAILEEAVCRAAAAGDAQFLDELVAVNTEPLCHGSDDIR
jgi:hypothetical protein